MKSYYILLLAIFVSKSLCAQVYTVNTDDDIDLGVCNAAHCSLREAINASENDGVASTIKFNIHGPGVHTIVPFSSFPTIRHSDLAILGESQPGGAGNIVIDFNNRNQSGNAFWEILGSRFYLSGIDFIDFAFNNPMDHLFQFGDTVNNTIDSKIYNCVFENDFAFVSGLSEEMIDVISADNLKISNCIFGTDRSKSAIFFFSSYIKIEATQEKGIVTIDSNVFLNNNKAILWAGGNLFVNQNIFGATDTFHNANFLNPYNAIIGANPGTNGLINDNFFVGYQKQAILSNAANNLTIIKNRFYDDVQDIQIKGVGNEVNIIADNVARDGRSFLNTEIIGEIDIERNDISNYDTVFYNINDPLNDKIRHIDNKLTCINKKVIVMDPKLFQSHKVPTINSVNTNQITGNGNPNDSIVVYSNNRSSCPKAVCEGGVELGRAHIDGSGNWILNATIPANNSISAYQFDSNPNQRPTLYSEFTPCYFCQGPVSIDYNPLLCSGQVINYRGKEYSELNPSDSILIKGNGVICDSIISIHVKFKPKYTEIKIPTCYPDSIYNDTLVFAGSICDSLVIISRFQVGVGYFSKTVCDGSSIKIGTTTFDKNMPSGIITLAGGSSYGCDSTIFVAINFVSIDTGVTFKQLTLIAHENAASYQWVDCDQNFMVLPNDTSQQFRTFRNGNYAVILKKEGCIDTSDCYMFIFESTKESKQENRIYIFPNPTYDKVKIESGLNQATTILIYNSNGQMIRKLMSESKIIELDLSNYDSGVYYVQFINSNLSLVNKIIKN